MPPVPPRPARLAALAALLFVAVLAAPPLRADEGMWTLDHLPLKPLQDGYGFTPNADWVDHVQKASVSFGGGSGAFVSPNGLVITNHHVARGQLQKVSSPEHNYVRDGFFARAPGEELKCPDLELRVLMSTEEVTARVQKAVDARATPEAQGAQRRAAIATIEKESNQATGLQSRVVELYRGGEFWLYRYQKYTDVRLVMAPEEGAAFFGGDPDNFSYPRHDLDFAFFRIYQNGSPVRPARWFHWSATGARENDLVFVSGNPGSTNRLLTVAQLEYLRDGSFPIRIAQQEHRLQALRAYEAQGAEPARRARGSLFGLENNLKRQRAFLQVLQEPALLEKKRADEAALRARVAREPRTAFAARSWDRIAAAQHELMRRNREHLYTDLARGARLVTVASQIVHYGDEVPKPNEKRYFEYRDSNLESLKFQLFSPAPVYPDLDAVILATQLQDALDALGPAHPWIKLALGGRTPKAVADELMQQTRLADIAVRKQLIEGGAAAVAASSDPLIVWTRKLEPSYREDRAWYEGHVQSVETQAGGDIARARFLLDGKSSPPDATGTLRLSYGKVAGYEQLTTWVPWRTTFAGLYDRAWSFDNQAPFELTPRVTEARSRVDLTTPLDFVCTADIIGGSSGSPVLNRDLEYVGLVFDGNVQSFGWNFAFDSTQGRTVSVHSRAIIEALRKIYGMEALADELTQPLVGTN
jgi:hypothetical protein